MVAIENGDLTQRQTLFPRFKDLLGYERGFFIDVLGGHDQGRSPSGRAETISLVKPVVLWAIEALVNATI